MDYGHQNSQGPATEGAFFTPDIGDNTSPWVNASGPSLNSDAVNDQPAPAELGVIRDTDPTPSTRNASLGSAALTAYFHPQGDHISADTMTAMDHLVADLKDNSKSLADTYDTAAAARQAYLAAAGFTTDNPDPNEEGGE